MKNTPYVSVIIPTYNRKDLLAACLASVEEQSYPKDSFEVIVVDDGSTDGTPDILSTYCASNASTRTIRQSNRGPAEARNQGALNSTGEIICFTDDDCRPDRDWIKNIVRAYKDEKTGGVGGRISAYSTEDPLNAYSEKNKFFDQENLIKVMAIGANSSFRTNVFLMLQGFDGFFSSSEDVDLGIRMQLAGYYFAYASDAIVRHNHRGTLQGILKQVYSYGRGYSLLHKKYPLNFSLGARSSYLGVRIVRKTLAAPFKTVRFLLDGKRGFLALEPFFDAAVITAELCGLISEDLFGKKYVGNAYSQKLDFVSSSGLPGGWGR
jgi:glycosyltransferase involved in cell wall biosynthesis